MTSLLQAATKLTTPFLPEDYLTLINPLWSTRDLRGRIEAVIPETTDAATLVVKPGRRWPAHQAGQNVRVSVDIDGVRHATHLLTHIPDQPQRRSVHLHR
ncbi:MAG: hypothetical protein NVSMB55_01130 [Mycobacteriales bacterium]